MHPSCSRLNGTADRAPFAHRPTFQPAQEARFDGYYFQGDFNKILGLVNDTQITAGSMIPMYDTVPFYRNVSLWSVHTEGTRPMMRN